jgi:3-hydroxyacyl-CoA dehydrogenase/enoyl-CoA hydratase/carnithine racemase
MSFWSLRLGFTTHGDFRLSSNEITNSLHPVKMNVAMSEPVLQLSFPEPDVAWLEFDQPGKSVNVLSRRVLVELANHLDALSSNESVRGLIIASGKPHCFLAGADITEIAHSLAASKPEQIAIFERGQQLFRQLSQLPFPTVAVVRGICLGGGAELASWCDARIFCRDETTEFGFPEVKLGLIPGWGGTVRLPRLIGLPNAVEMITSGESISAQRACELKLADDWVSADLLTSAAIARVRALNTEQALQQQRMSREQPVVMSPVEKKFLAMTAQAKLRQETQGHYPAPLAAVELMVVTAEQDVSTALAHEAEVMSQCLGSPVNLALLNVFHATDRLKKSGASIHAANTKQEWNRVGVIGAGIMGSSIAATFLKRSIPTTLMDASGDAIQQAWPGIVEQLGYNKAIRRHDAQQALQRLSLLQATQSLSNLADCELLIEAIAENLAVKANLFAEIENIVSPATILASNTSTISISTMAQGLRHPERMCGLHFFNPVPRMKLVEVIRGNLSSNESIAQAAALMRKIGKFPLIVKDSPGFLVNRILSPYLNAALELLSQGAEIEAIDREALAFGMPIGPLALYDMVGLDTAFQAGRTMWEAFSNRFTASPILPALIKAGRLGQKNGLGFYRYVAKKPTPLADPTAVAIVETYQKSKLALSPEQIQWRLILPMLLEAVRTLEEGIVSDPREVDAGLIYGLGFPPYRGGLLFWADQLGIPKIQERIDSLAATGKTVAEPALFHELATANRKFYSLGTERSAR